MKTRHTVYPKKYAHGFCFAVLCCVYTLADFPISIRLTSLALWQFNDCPSASKATLMNMDKCIMWIHYEWLHNHNKAKHNKTVCIFLGIYCNAMSQLHQERKDITVPSLPHCGAGSPTEGPTSPADEAEFSVKGPTSPGPTSPRGRLSLLISTRVIIFMFRNKTQVTDF